MLSALFGGMLIGFAATLYWIGTGRVAGISGILAGALRGGGGRGDRLVFLSGLLGAGVVTSWFGAVPASHPRGIVVLMLAGLLVGLGTRLAQGCTSGHGVCGISRFSPRSIAATVVFMLTGAATVWMFGNGGTP